jgi:hypothetical protein
MNYPVEILPNPAFKIIDCELSDHFLIRFFNCNDVNDITNPETGQIKIQHICSPAEKIDDLSLSLLGIYRPEHITLNFTVAGKEKYMHYCKPDEAVDVPVFDTEFNHSSGRFFWCANIKKLNNRTFDYTRGHDPFIATCLVKHTPMKWNYWHFSLRWSTDLGLLDNLDERQRKNIAKRIGQAVRVTISHFEQGLLLDVYLKNVSPELKPNKDKKMRTYSKVHFYSEVWTEVE